MKNTLVWVNNENMFNDFSLQKYEHFFHIYSSNQKDTTFRLISKEMKNSDCDKIIKIYDDYKFELIFKKNSVWSSLKFEDIVTNWHINKKNKPLNVSKHIELFDRFKTSSKIEFPYKINKNNIDIYREIIVYIMTEPLINLIEPINDMSISTINEEMLFNSPKNYNDFKKTIESGNHKGIAIKNKKILDNEIVLTTKYGNIIVSKSEEGVNVFGVLKNSQQNIAELFSFSEGTKKNIITYLVNDVKYNNVPKRISKRTIVTSVFSIIFVALMLWLTYSLILSPKNIGFAMDIMFSKYSWTHSWIYLLWINFFISLFIIPLVAIIFIKAQDPKKKVSLKSHMNIFVSAQVRLVAAFLTGNPMIATIIWGWYLSSTRGLRLVGVVGLVTSVNIIRGVIIIPIGILFMVRGTIFNHMIFQEMGMMKEYYLLVSLSWLGWIWHTVEHLAINLLIVLPPLHILFSKMMGVYYGGTKDSEKVINKFTTFEMNLVHLKHSYKNIFSNRERLFKMSLTMFIVILIETFEFTFGLRLVEDYAVQYSVFSDLTSNGQYWNVFAISGVRYMSSFIRHLPIIAWIPGQGIGFTEAVLEVYTEGVINNAHGWGILTESTVESLSEQTTFVMRFFNFYLKRLIAIGITAVFVPLAIHKRNQKIKEGVR